MTGRKGIPPARTQGKLPIGGLSPEELHAISIVGKEATKWRDSLVPGSFDVDLLMRIDGLLSVGEEQTRVVTSAPTLVDVLAFVFGKLGEKTRAKVHAALAELAVANQSITPPKPDPVLLGMAQGAVDLMTLRSQKEIRGSVAGQFTITRLPGRAA